MYHYVIYRVCLEQLHYSKNESEYMIHYDVVLLVDLRFIVERFGLHNNSRFTQK